MREKSNGIVTLISSNGRENYLKKRQLQSFQIFACKKGRRYLARAGAENLDREKAASWQRGQQQLEKIRNYFWDATMFIFRQSLFSWLSILTQQQREGGVRTNNGGIDRVLCLVFVLHLFFSQKLLKIVSSDNNQTRNKYFSLRKRKCHRAPSFFYIF